MSYIVLARRYRPQTFDEVVGQEHITELLKGAISSGKIAHAYLFAGPRGIGKTSCARILAKSLNCQKGPTLTPCGECPACKEITAGTSFDVMEIDGASNRGIDEIRTLRENVKFGPGYGRYKIYIVDEVHMLTPEAFNALLKTLEEPPEHAKFIFATTDPNKIPATILSRCQRYDFKRLTLKVLVGALDTLCKKEKLTVDQDALYAIAKAAQGSFRDALSILDQISAFSDRRVEVKDVCAMLGLVEVDAVFAICEALAQKDCAEALNKLDEILEQGKDAKQLAKDLVEHFRNLMVIKVGGKALGKLVDYPVAIKDQYLAQSANFTLNEILNAIDCLIAAQEMARVTESLRIPLEIAFAKMNLGSAPVNRPTAFPAPQVRIAATPAPEPDPARTAAVNMLKNQKGQVNASTAESLAANTPSAGTSATEPEIPAIPAPVEPPKINTAGGVTIDSIRQVWATLTHAVSCQKMSLATYLQEGFPIGFDGEKLIIGFAPQFDFYKSSLESDDYLQIVEGIFGEQLGRKIVLEYKITSDAPTVEQKNDEPAVQKALETFKGSIVSQWHN